MNQERSQNLGPDTQPSVRKVVLVGHCGFDGFGLTRAVKATLPGMAVESVHDAKGLQQHAGSDALLLINRVLDGRFATGSGNELIADLTARPDPPRLMLISNYPDAQARAEADGALPGFGKNELGGPGAADKLRAAAGADPASG
jgi:hypothetical protein